MEEGVRRRDDIIWRRGTYDVDSGVAFACFFRVDGDGGAALVHLPPLTLPPQIHPHTLSRRTTYTNNYESLSDRTLSLPFTHPSFPNP